MGAALLDFQYQLETLECATCYITFAIPGKFISDRRKDHLGFYCPYGHSNVYNAESETEKLRKVVAEKERALEWQRAEVATLRKRNEHTENRDYGRPRAWSRKQKPVLLKASVRVVVIASLTLQRTWERDTLTTPLKVEKVL